MNENENADAARVPDADGARPRGRRRADGARFGGSRRRRAEWERAMADAAGVADEPYSRRTNRTSTSTAGRSARRRTSPRRRGSSPPPPPTRMRKTTRMRKRNPKRTYLVRTLRASRSGIDARPDGEPGTGTRGGAGTGTGTRGTRARTTLHLPHPRSRGASHDAGRGRCRGRLEQPRRGGVA